MYMPKGKGGLLLQKTYTPDFLKKRSVKNNGERDQYYIENDHEAIIPPDEWEAVQLERERRQAFKLRYNVPYIRNGIDPIHPFAGKIICGQCNDVYKAYEGDRFKCRRRIETGARECTAPNIYVKDMEIAFIRAWRELLSDTAARAKWEEKIKSGNSLERLRGKQFIALAGSADEEYSPELVMTVLEKVTLYEDGLGFSFFDGTELKMTDIS